MRHAATRPAQASERQCLHRIEEENPIEASDRVEAAVGANRRRLFDKCRRGWG
jgi:hypothetical protein